MKQSGQVWAGRLVTMVVCGAVAFSLTVQLRGDSGQSAGNNSYTARAEQLQLQLDEEIQKSEALYEQVLKFQQELETYKQQAEEQGGYTAVLAQQLDRANLMAGLSQVEGPGLTVTMHDSDQSNENKVNENFFIIHDEDVLRVINELRDAGAEALSINGERLLATSEIRCSGSTISINNNRYASPFVITAIGNATEMENALNMRQGVVEVLASWGIRLDIVKGEKLVVPAYAGNLEYRYAATVKAES